MARAVYAIATSEQHAQRIASRLETAGIPANDVSILAADRGLVEQPAAGAAPAPPEVTAAGMTGGAVLGGTLGWLAGIGLVFIPGLGPIIAAGPLVAALSGVALGGAVGGVAAAFVGLGVPEAEARQLETRIHEGSVLVAVQANNAARAAEIEQILHGENAEAIVTSR
jgi:hypothetical protein